MPKPKSISRSAAATETVPVEILATDMADLRHMAEEINQPLPFLLEMIYATGTHQVRRLYNRARASERRASERRHA